MNEQKILALPRTERRMQLSFKEEEDSKESAIIHFDRHIYSLKSD